MKPRTENQPHANVKVEDWLESGNCAWKEQTVRDEVHQSDVEVVINIPVPWDRRKNSLRWPHTRNDRITVRPAYHSITCINGRDDPNRGNHLQQQVDSATTVWASILNVKVCPKIQMFMWKLVSNAIAMKLNLV